MKKIVLGAVLVLFITIGFGVYYVLSNLDDLVKVAIEKYGSEATRTAVRVEKVNIGLQDGSGAILGVTVGNPQGFETKQAFSLGEVSTQIDLNSLSGDVIVIEHITMRAPEVFFELNAAGQANLNVLKKNLSSTSAGSTSSVSPNKNQTNEPKLIVRKVLFENGVIFAKVVALDKEYKLDLPKLEMKNLGGDKGATPTEITNQVIRLLVDRAMTEVQKKGLDQYKDKLKSKVDERLKAEQQKLNEKVGEQVGDQVGEKLKGLLDYK
jgi:uncharacterized protein involved in outer membrane biogenesis